MPDQGIISKMEVETMTMVIDANPVPLRADPDGTIRVVGTRLTLDTIVTAYRDGAPPEEIARRFPGISLPDTYAVIGYYLRYPREVEAYLDAQAGGRGPPPGDRGRHPTEILPRSIASKARGEIGGDDPIAGGPRL